MSKIGYIYRIFSPSTGLQYFGSTTRNVVDRFKAHLDLAKNDVMICSSKKVIDCGDAQVECFASVEYNNPYELRMFETDVINSHKCVNIANPSCKTYIQNEPRPGEDGIYYGTYLPPPKPLTTAQKLARQRNKDRRRPSFSPLYPVHHCGFLPRRPNYLSCLHLTGWSLNRGLNS